MSLDPVVPKDAWDLSVKVMTEATGVHTDHGDTFLGWPGSIATRVLTVKRLGPVMEAHGLSLSADWKEAVAQALKADEAVLTTTGVQVWTMQHVWHTAMAAVHDGILRARHMEGIPPIVLQRACFPHNLFDYYDPPGRK